MQRLIDQQIIRREIETGSYDRATPVEVDQMLKGIGRRNPSGYGITDLQLRSRIAWQVTVLHFIEQRFRPAVLVSEDEIAKYAKAHNLEHDQAQDQLVAQRVNTAFEDWLNRAEKRAKVEYHEADLK